jgi:DNA-binding transcriptional LysR family regulator
MSAGATRLHVSQQALSRTVAALEQRMGARLFERLPRCAAPRRHLIRRHRDRRTRHPPPAP